MTGTKKDPVLTPRGQRPWVVIPVDPERLHGTRHARRRQAHFLSRGEAMRRLCELAGAETFNVPQDAPDRLSRPNLIDCWIVVTQMRKFASGFASGKMES